MRRMMEHIDIEQELHILDKYKVLSSVHDADSLDTAALASALGEQGDTVPEGGNISPSSLSSSPFTKSEFPRCRKELRVRALVQLD